MIIIVRRPPNGVRLYKLFAAFFAAMAFTTAAIAGTMVKSDPNGFYIWGIGGLVCLALVLLFLVLDSRSAAKKEERKKKRLERAAHKSDGAHVAHAPAHAPGH